LDTSLASNQFARVTVQADYDSVTNGLFYYRVWVDGIPSLNPQTWYATADASQNSFGGLVAQGDFILDDLVVTSPTIIISNISRNMNGGVQLDCLGMPSLSHRVWSADTLSSAPLWQVISTNLSAPDGSWQFTDTNTTGSKNRFYRATLP
jgi:hypothetical protein